MTDERADNVAVARSSYEAFGRGDLDGALAMMDDDIEWHQAQGLPHGGVYKGLRRCAPPSSTRSTRSGGRTSTPTPEEFLGGGDHVVVLGRYTGRGKRTGAPLDIPFAHVWQFRDGRAVRFHQFTDTRGWVEALGLADPIDACPPRGENRVLKRCVVLAGKTVGRDTARAEATIVDGPSSHEGGKKLQRARRRA